MRNAPNCSCSCSGNAFVVRRDEAKSAPTRQADAADEDAEPTLSTARLALLGGIGTAGSLCVVATVYMGLRRQYQKRKPRSDVEMSTGVGLRARTAQGEQGLLHHVSSNRYDGARQIAPRSRERAGSSFDASGAAGRRRATFGDEEVDTMALFFDPPEGRLARGSQKGSVAYVANPLSGAAAGDSNDVNHSGLFYYTPESEGGDPSCNKQLLDSARDELEALAQAVGDLSSESNAEALMHVEAEITAARVAFDDAEASLLYEADPTSSRILNDYSESARDFAAVLKRARRRLQKVHESAVSTSASLGSNQRARLLAELHRVRSRLRSTNNEAAPRE